MSESAKRPDETGEKRSPRREKRRRQILAAAQQAFSEKGYVATTIDDIVQRVPVARGTFYLYFEDRLDVFRVLVNDFFARVATSIQPIMLGSGAPPPREQLRENLVRVLDLARTEPGMVKIALSTATGVDGALDAEVRIFFRSLHTFMDETFETGQSIGLVRPGDRSAMVAIALGSMQALLLGVVRGELDIDRHGLADGLMSFLESGLLDR
jgi:AcrR family transcriptional regulator